MYLYNVYIHTCMYIYTEREREMEEDWKQMGLPEAFRAQPCDYHC